MQRRGNRGIIRALTLTLLLSLSMSTTCFAYNNDDIRRLVGRPEVDTIEFHDYLDYIDSLAIENTEQETQTDNSNTSTSLKESLLGRVKRMESSRADYQRDLAKELLEGKMLYEVEDTVHSIYTISNSLNSFKLADYFSSFEVDTTRHETSWYFEKENISTIQEEVAYTRTLINDSYDIGGIGTQKQYPITSNDLPKIIVSTGFKGLRGDTVTNGTYFTFNSSPNEQAVIAMFNGIVTRVESSDTWGNWVEVQSGKGLRISYSYLDKVSVKPGDSIKQGDIISIGTQNGEVYIEVQLDNQYLNPCILLGNDGITAHNDWYNLYPGDRGEASKEVYREMPQKTTSSIWQESTYSGNTVQFEEIPETTEAVNGWGN